MKAILRFDSEQNLILVWRIFMFYYVIDTIGSVL